MQASGGWEPSCRTAQPVAFNSIQLKKAEKNYLVHEKELLAIVNTLKKWQVDLLGNHITIYTDHCTLENFNTQCDLSQCQLRWQEFLSQFECTINYIHGGDNTAADTLSWLPTNAFPEERLATNSSSMAPNVIVVTLGSLAVTVDPALLTAIRQGYQMDAFCQNKPVDSRGDRSKWPLVRWLTPAHPTDG